MSETPIPSRYTIVREEFILNSSLLTARRRGGFGVGEDETVSQPGGMEYDPFLVLVAVLIVFLVALLIIFTISVSRAAGSVSRPIYSYSGIAERSSRNDGLTYSYEGVKRVLRDLMMLVRKRNRCVHCTAREVSRYLAGLSTDHIRLYEDIVYGDRNIEKARSLVEFLRRLVG